MRYAELRLDASAKQETKDVLHYFNDRFILETP